jgi:hypothetical protein
MPSRYSTVAIISSIIFASVAAFSVSSFNHTIALAQTSASNAGNQTSGLHRITTTYMASNSTIISPTTNGTAVAFCQAGDAVLSGGYASSFAPVRISQPIITLVSDTPVLVQEGNSKQQGWKVEMVNQGGSPIKLTSNALCVGIRETK